MFSDFAVELYVLDERLRVVRISRVLSGLRPRLEEDDVTVASAMCAHAALCINNARQYMREWIIASTVQRKLLPRSPTTQTTVEIPHRTFPALRAAARGTTRSGCPACGPR
ncbi:hypothetical protein ABZ904_45855 [Streptomyces sp. NPDC046900]|uniref:hypothetical protein n=1 Tax=Streptomyces sp. NPDC046900 TaxID=3155473 RepID=UPI0033FFF78F